MHTCFSKQPMKATRLGGGRVRQAADPIKMQLVWPQVDSWPTGRELLKLH